MFETSYSHVEAALVRAYNVPEKTVGAFRGRLGNMQKLGLFGSKNMPGRGAALVYGPDQFHRLIFACELSEFGIYPATVLTAVETLWESRLVQIFKKAEHVAERTRDPGPDDIVMHVGGLRGMTAAWSELDAIPNVNACALSKLPTYVDAWMRMDRLPTRALIVNLSDRLRRFHDALKDLHMAEIKRARDETKGRPKAMTMTRLVTEKEAADAVGIELATFRAWVASGKLPKPIPECGKFDLKAHRRGARPHVWIGRSTNALDAWRAKGDEICAYILKASTTPR